LCPPTPQRSNNPIVLKILQIISFVFNILQIKWPVSGLFGGLCRNRYPGGWVQSSFSNSLLTLHLRLPLLIQYSDNFRRRLVLLWHSSGIN
jgi:hypothetical protein